VPAARATGGMSVHRPSFSVSYLLIFTRCRLSLSLSVTFILFLSSFYLLFLLVFSPFFVIYPFFLNMLSPLLNIAIFSKGNKKLVEALMFSENNPHLKKSQFAVVKSGTFTLS
jgi:hypothetical protein